jgi:hypothetical protein
MLTAAQATTLRLILYILAKTQLYPIECYLP